MTEFVCFQTVQDVVRFLKEGGRDSADERWAPLSFHPTLIVDFQTPEKVHSCAAAMFLLSGVTIFVSSLRWVDELCSVSLFRADVAGKGEVRKNQSHCSKARLSDLVRRKRNVGKTHHNSQGSEFKFCRGCWEHSQLFHILKTADLKNSVQSCEGVLRLHPSSFSQLPSLC